MNRQTVYYCSNGTSVQQIDINPHGWLNIIKRIKHVKQMTHIIDTLSFR